MARWRLGSSSRRPSSPEGRRRDRARNARGPSLGSTPLPACSSRRASVLQAIVGKCRSLTSSLDHNQSIYRDASLSEQPQRPAKHNEPGADPTDGTAIVLVEISHRLVIGNKSTRQTLPQHCAQSLAQAGGSTDPDSRRFKASAAETDRTKADRTSGATLLNRSSGRLSSSTKTSIT